MVNSSRIGIELAVPGLYRGELTWVTQGLYRGRWGPEGSGELDSIAMDEALNSYCATRREVVNAK